MSAALPRPDDVARIVVRLTNWVGDAVMNTPLLGALRSTFRHAEITAVGRAHVAALMAPHPDVDRVVTIDDRKTRGYAQAVATLRGLRADVGFALPNSLNAATLLWLGGARCRVGYARDARRWLLTHPVALRPRDLAVHEVRYYLRLLSPWIEAGLAPAPDATPPLSLAVGDDERATMRVWLAQRGIDPAARVIGVNPAALYGTAKRWPAERYAAAAAQLAAHLNARVVVTGLKTEREVAQSVCDAAAGLGDASFVNGAGEMSLRGLMAFLAHAQLFLTNDSGAMHIAAALGTPTVAVFGSTDWLTTAPVSPRAVIVREATECAPCLLRDCPIDHRCMTRVGVDRVVAEASALLARIGTQSA